MNCFCCCGTYHLAVSAFISKTSCTFFIKLPYAFVTIPIAAGVFNIAIDNTHLMAIILLLSIDMRYL